MALFTIADLHLSLGTDKPMDIFSGWDDYVPRLEHHWRATVGEEDTVVVGGDISWAMSLEETVTDFAFLHRLPGQKILLKGNHDYWWSTMSKLNAFVKEKSFTSLRFLFNNSYSVNGVSVCGTRGWMFEEGEAHDAKVAAREEGRLRLSLQAAETQQKLVFLHYPPIAEGASSTGMIATMQEHGVRQCYYGHLHGASIRWAVQGNIEGIQYKLVSADSLSFAPLRVEIDKI